MNFEYELRQSTLARKLRIKAIANSDEWLKFHLSSYHLGEQSGYEHFKNKPVYFINGFKLPEHLVCVKTSECFFPQQFQTSPCYEIAIFDTIKEVIIYYLLCV